MPKKNAKEKGGVLKKKKTRENIEKKEDKKHLKEEIKEVEKLPIINDNEFQANESIVKILVDKIITLSVREAQTISINKKLHDYYFDSLKTQINNMFAESNIFFSNEPEPSIIDNSSFFKADFNKCNTWVEISEPNSSKCDRFENIFMNFKEIKTNLSQENNSEINNKLNKKRDSKDSNSVNDDYKRKLIKKYTSNFNKINEKQNNLDVLEEKSSIESKEDESKSQNKKSPRKSFHSISRIQNNNINNKTQSILNDIKKNTNFNTTNISMFSTTNKNYKIKKNQILDLPFKDIPGINEEYNHKKYEPPNINFLRRELEEQIEKKSKEDKEQNSLSKQNLRQKQKEDEEKKKEEKKLKYFDSNKLTFDPNGKIISFKPLKIDAFPKDFAFLRNNVKSFNKINKKKLKKKITKKDDETIQTTKEKEKEKENNNIPKIENIIKNPEDDPNGINKKNFLKIDSSRHEKIVPGGSNFSIMLPNVGVVLKQNEQIKKGNRDFGKFFKKYSMEDYDKILKDYLPLQNKTMVQSKIGNMINSNNNEELSNPLINSDNESFKNNNINLLKTMKINKNIISNSLLSSQNFHHLSVNSNKNISTGNLGGIIKLNKNNISSLKVELDSLKDLDYKERNFYSPDKTGMKNINLFGKKYNYFFRNINKDKNMSVGVNEFNKSIITNTGWGNKTMRKNMSSGNLLIGKHQTRYQALRELGSNLLNGIKIKFPRNRKINLKI